MQEGRRGGGLKINGLGLSFVCNLTLIHLQDYVSSFCGDVPKERGDKQRIGRRKAAKRGSGAGWLLGASSRKGAVQRDESLIHSN